MIPAIVALFAARDGGRVGAVAIAFFVAVGASAGRIAFDSLLQRDGPEHLRGRAFARFETRFQLVVVRGALIPVALLNVLTRRSGFFLLALVLGFAGLSYVGGLRARHQWGGQSATDPQPETRSRRSSRRVPRSPRKPAAGYDLARYNYPMELIFRPIVADDLPGFLARRRVRLRLPP